MTEAEKRATKKYEETHTVQVHLKLNLRTDDDILRKLAEVSNKQGYIKNLIRRDLYKQLED